MTMNKILQGTNREFMDSEQDTLQKFLLISGQFSAEEAKEVLTCLISSKLSFHSKKKMRSFEHTGQVDQKSLERIRALEKMRLEILKLIEEGEKKGCSFNIHSDINVKLV